MGWEVVCPIFPCQTHASTSVCQSDLVCAVNGTRMHIHHHPLCACHVAYSNAAIATAALPLLLLLHMVLRVGSRRQARVVPYFGCCAAAVHGRQRTGSGSTGRRRTGGVTAECSKVGCGPCVRQHRCTRAIAAADDHNVRCTVAAAAQELGCMQCYAVAWAAGSVTHS